MESIAAHLKGRISILDLIECPFNEIHELYKIVYDKAEARAKEEEEKAKREREEEERKKQSERTAKGMPQLIKRNPVPTDGSNNKKSNSTSSFSSDDLEDAFEELIEGGAF